MSLFMSFQKKYCSLEPSCLFLDSCLFFFVILTCSMDSKKEKRVFFVRDKYNWCDVFELLKIQFNINILNFSMHCVNVAHHILRHCTYPCTTLHKQKKKIRLKVLLLFLQHHCTPRTKNSRHTLLFSRI